MTFYIDSRREHCSLEIGHGLRKCIQQHFQHWTELVFLCIGSDRITGDSLGPYVGYNLSGCRLPGTALYGTLESPVHAMNLSSTLTDIYQNHKSPLVIAIDASLGTKKHLGFVTIGNGKLYPGAGVHKQLPAAGDIFITGIVSYAGMLEHFSLQNTRLYTVISMANAITDGILYAYRSCCQRFPQLLEEAPRETAEDDSLCFPETFTASARGETAFSSSRPPFHTDCSIYPPDK